MEPLFRDSVIAQTAPGPRILKGAAIGAVVGATAGLAAAFIATHHKRSGYVDHSEDGLVAVAFLELGFAIGLVVGGVVGYFRE